MPQTTLVDAVYIAKLLAIKPCTIRRMALLGQIPYYKVGRNYRFNTQEVIVALKSGTRGER